MVRGKTFTADQIDALDNTEIEKLYARYEARLGAVMTKTLGSAALQIYTGTVAMFLTIENQPGLIAHLESDPFVGLALSSATCELYHRYGMFLAPLTAALTTLKHCQFGHCCPVGVYHGGDEAGESRDGGGASIVERVTEKVKDPKKVVAGRAGTAARKAKQEERLLEQLRVAKESFRPPAGDDTSANIPPKEAAAVSQTERREGLTNWTVFLQSAQTRRPASAAPVDSAPKQPAPCARQLKTRDPFYME